MPRKQTQIDKQLVEDLAAIGCTDAEIAAICRVSERTIQRRCREALDIGRARLKSSLKRKQVELALEGNVSMLIWLGKQYLDQRERQDINHTTGETSIEELSDEQLAAIAARGRQRTAKAKNGKKKAD